MMRDHGGNLDWAIERWGGAADDWVDLSTGINPVAYPVPEISLHAWAALPTRTDLVRLCDVARAAYGTSAEVLPLAGATAAIQMIPQIVKASDARILGPTYNEHAASFTAAGWQVEEVGDLGALAGAGAAVVVNPNNPNGQKWTPEILRDLAKDVGVLVVDESFADPEIGLSLAGDVPSNVLVLRSFGKFYGLAGVRLGFVLGEAALLEKLAVLAGPWPISGAAIEIGCAALGDEFWHAQTISRLAEDAARLDDLATSAGWHVVGGSKLFRLYDVTDAAAVQEALAEGNVWSRVFPYAPRWLRLGLPGPKTWDRLEKAITRCCAA